MIPRLSYELIMRMSVNSIPVSVSNRTGSSLDSDCLSTVKMDVSYTSMAKGSGHGYICMYIVRVFGRGTTVRTVPAGVFKYG